MYVKDSVYLYNKTGLLFVLFQSREGEVGGGVGCSWCSGGNDERRCAVPQDQILSLLSPSPSRSSLPPTIPALDRLEDVCVIELTQNTLHSRSTSWLAIYMYMYMYLFEVGRTY